MFGCPHFTLEEAQYIAKNIEGKKLAIPMYILVSSHALQMAERMGIKDVLDAAGAELIADSCPDQSCWHYLKGKVGITESPKCAYYPRRRGINFMIRDLDTCIETLFNGSAGLGCGYRNDRFALDLTLPAYFYKKATSAPETHLPFDQGWGIYPQLSGTLTLPQFSIHLVCGYWYGHHFISSRGSHLFQSTSWFDPDFCQAERHLATFDISISHCYRQLDFAIDAQFYYDPDHRKLDLAVGIAMRFNKSWRIF